MSFIQWCCERGAKSHGKRTKKKPWRKRQSRSCLLFVFFQLLYFITFFLHFIYPRHLPTPTTHDLYPRPTTHDPRPTTFSYTPKWWTQEIFMECYCVARNKPIRSKRTKPQTATVISLRFACVSWTLLWLASTQSTFLKFFRCSRFSEFDSNAMIFLSIFWIS